MNKQPSQIVIDFIAFIDANPLTHEDIQAHLRIMSDNFKQQEAEAFRSIKALNKYYGVQAELIIKSNKLTGRG